MRRSLASLVALAVAAVPVVVQVAPAQALQAPVAFTSQALPTYQTNGIAWSVAQAGGRVFVGGTFTSVRPGGVNAGTGEVPRAGLAVLDAATGQPTSCAPSFTLSTGAATVRALDVSPDGRTLYVGGQFSAVDGVAQPQLAAIDLATCTLVPGFRPRPDGVVRALRSTSSTVYVGGTISTVGGVRRSSAAAVAAVGTARPGELLPWAPVFDQDVRALALSPDGTRVVAGGDFDTVGGADSHALAVLGAGDAALVKAYPVGFLPANSVVKDLAVDATGFYTGNEGTGSGVFDGRIALDWSTLGQRWRDTCLGATQAVVAYRGVLYSGSHAHDCSSMGAYADGARHHLLAQSTSSPTLLSWFPDTNDGIGEQVGPRDLVVAAGTGGDVLWAVGEFTIVNGVRQQGMTRFGQGVDTVAPSTPTTSIASPAAGQARIAWRSSLDADDADLSYGVYRDGSSTPLTTTRGSSLFWTRPQLSFTDTTVAPGSTHTYRVGASDGTTTTYSPWRSVTVATTSPSPYADRVLADGAQLLWQYGESGDVFVADRTTNDLGGTLRGGATRAVAPGAIAGEAGRAITLSGGSSTIYTEARLPRPAAYTVETWFRTTTTSGGKLIGFGDKQTAQSSSYDKHVYMTDAGRLVFGVYAGGTHTISTPAAYNDGAWHHVAATQGSAGMALYVDGVRVGRDPLTTSQDYAGYWRVGGDSLAGWPGRPTSDFLAGSLDETAVYPSALSAAAVRAHAVLGGVQLPGGAQVPSDPYASAVLQDGPELYWRLGADTGATATDSSGAAAPGTVAGAVAPGRPGAVAGTADTAVRLSGGTVTAQAPLRLTAFSEEAWFRTTSRTGGRLLGLGSAATGRSSSYDKHLYLTAGGQVVLGVYPGRVVTLTSPRSYADGAYHHVVATQGPDGLALWLDGELVAHGAETASQAYDGCFRVGPDPLDGWPQQPATAALEGDVDEVALYAGALPAARVGAHFAAGRPAPVDTAAPTAPGALTAGSTTGGVQLSWTASTDDRGVTAYEVHRSGTAGTTPTAATRVATTAGTSYTDAAVAAGTAYYRVVAVDAAGNRSAASTEVQAVVADRSAPTVPAGLRATASGSDVALTWTTATDDVGVTGYEVFRSATPGTATGPATRVAATTTATHVDAGRPAGTWAYRVVALDGAGNRSADSLDAVVTVGAAPSTVVLTPTADGWTNAGAPSSALGADASLSSRGEPGAVSYLRFALPAAPPGTVLTSAQLRVRTTTLSTAGSLDPHTVQAAADGWTEPTLTWKTRPAPLGPVLGTLSGATRADTAYAAQLDPAGLTALLGSATTLSLSSTGTDSLYVWSRERATAAQRPQLVLVYGPA